MRIPRLLLIPLLISLSAVTAAAQALPPSAPDSSQPTSVLSQNSEAGIAFVPLFGHLQGSSTLTRGSVLGEHDSGPMPASVYTKYFLTTEQNETTCYALRTYRVARVSPESDTTRLSGYSTCQRATRFQLRTAVDSKTIEYR
jgi:hypothetical protein